MSEASPAQGTESNLRIAVSGDSSIDWFTLTEKSDAPKPAVSLRNWQLEEQVRSFALPGGCLLLAEMVKAAVPGAQVRSCMLPPDIHSIPPTTLIHSHAVLQEYAKNRSGEDTCLRVARYGGFSGSAGSSPQFGPIEKDDGRTDVLVLDDVGNGYRETNSAWPKCLENGAKPHVIYKHHQPLFQGPLFNLIAEKHAERTVCILEADNLRAFGISLSRGISWEKTTEDFVNLLGTSDVLSPIINMQCVIVRLGQEGALVLFPRRGKQPGLWLCYSSGYLEGWIRRQFGGSMNGIGCAFVAGLVADLLEKTQDTWGEARLVQAAEEGIRAALRHHYLGLYISGSSLKYGSFGEPADRTKSEVRREEDELSILEHQVCSLAIDEHRLKAATSGARWSILGLRAGSRVEDSALRWVQTGAAGSFECVPIGAFGGLTTIDRAEMECYSSVEILMEHYLNRRTGAKPLSIAVFGEPGSGKSFGVKQIARSLSKVVETKGLDFDLSQFAGPGDLVAAFKQIREVALGGKIPLAFFDEFDTPLAGEPLGWVKAFLAPMQEGTFRDGSQIHNIGRAILVFAGSTHHTHADFAATCGSDGAKNSKARDFLGRLKGFIDVCGPNPLHAAGGLTRCPYIGETEHELAAILRRATVLRSLLHVNGLVGNDGTARVDEPVLRTMLRIPRYKHGVRSMEAVLLMSNVVDHEVLGPSSLPPAHLLDMHVDAEAFHLTLLFVKARDAMGQIVHEMYARDNPGTPLAKLSFEKLDPHFQADNKRQFDSIPRKLAEIRCRVAAKSSAPESPVVLNDEEIELLARMEHDRYVRDKLADGWRYGKETDRANKINNTLVPWEELPDAEKAKDIQAVEKIPQLLDLGGFAIVRDQE